MNEYMKWGAGKWKMLVEKQENPEENPKNSDIAKHNRPLSDT